MSSLTQQSLEKERGKTLATSLKWLVVCTGKEEKDKKGPASTRRVNTGEDEFHFQNNNCVLFKYAHKSVIQPRISEPNLFSSWNKFLRIIPEIFLRIQCRKTRTGMYKFIQQTEIVFFITHSVYLFVKIFLTPINCYSVPHVTFFSVLSTDLKRVWSIKAPIWRHDARSLLLFPLT